VSSVVDARSQRRERLDVGSRPAQRGLEDDPDAVVSGVAKRAIEVERLVGRARVLHVDADEVAARGRVLDDRDEVRPAELVAEVETETGELDTDVRVEPAALDVGEDVLVGADDRGCVLLVRDLLAEDVDRRHLALRVHATHRLARVLQLGPGDVTLRQFLDDRARHRREQPDDRAVEQHQRSRMKP
jgi:hypothetical protein